MTRYSDYDRFAWVYNKHWGNNFTHTALEVLDKLVFPYVPARARILDLCCGTGQLAEQLLARGYAVTGLDASAEMLRLAHENAPAAEFVLKDARSFTLPPVYHVVVSTFDSLNHMMTLEELTSVFRNVRAALRRGGLFLFDLNMEEGFKVCWNDNFGIVEDDHACIVRTSYRAQEKVARFETTIFRLEDSWHRSDVTLVQKCYSEAEVRGALQMAGFTSISAYAYDEQLHLKALTEGTERGFFVSRKPKPAKPRLQG